MYLVLGDNAEEIAVDSPEELHQWIMEGKVQGRTPLKFEEEDGQWLPLDSYAEFAAVLQAREAGLKIPHPSVLQALRHAPPRKSPWAIASLILGILGFVTFGLSSVLGLVCGVIAKGQINKSNGRVKGSTEALAGMILSLVSIVVVFAMIPYLIRWLKKG
jgi:hypothetical protein